MHRLELPATALSTPLQEALQTASERVFGAWSDADLQQLDELLDAGYRQELQDQILGLASSLSENPGACSICSPRVTCTGVWRPNTGPARWPP